MSRNKSGFSWGSTPFEAPALPSDVKLPPASMRVDPELLRLSGTQEADSPTPGTPAHAAWQEEQRKAVIAAARRAMQIRAHLAKKDPSIFNSYVLRDERTGKQIAQAPMHLRWHDLLSKHPRLVMWSHVEGGKTTQIAVGRTLWELGNDPNLRVCVVSNTTELAVKMTRQIAQYIEKSAELKQVFPNLKPTSDPGQPWKGKALTVERPGIGAKDPSIQATGVHGNIIGSRIDLLILDDILDHENTSTAGPRDDLYRWVKSSLMSRLTENARVWVVGNAWNPDDMMHRMEKEDGFHAERFPVLSIDGECTWPERWSSQRIAQARQDLGPLEYARQLLCQARDDSSARFKQEWIDTCLEAGNGISWCENIQDLARPDSGIPVTDALVELGGVQGVVVHGVDLAVQKHDAADSTVIFSLLVLPDGTRRILSIRSGKWAGPEIIAQIESTYDRLGGTFIVENNAAQGYIIQFLQQSGHVIPVIPFTTGRNKAHPEFGIESMAAELAGGRWQIPNQGGKMHAEASAWVQELLYYDPREHTGDRLMASWFAREGARKLGPSNRSTGIGIRIF